MRKLHINQFSELVKTLKSACQELREQKDKEFIYLCSEIQEFVSRMFEYAESSFGEETKISYLLRDFYESIFFISQGQMDIEHVYDIVSEIQQETLDLKPDKIEVVFYCYKASMSDSLESVYFAAKSDPMCDAYFIPIPYFDRNSDGSLGKMHFEGQGYYSEQYELTNWQEYDVNERRPDIIFIMNPYDGQNLVTSVHPYFYSSRLKKCTNMLVYIEYGLAYWVYRDPFGPEEFDNYRKNVIISPGFVHCDYGITYSKELAEGYQPLFGAHPEIAEPYGITKEMVKEKFIALGSPKFDKVVSTKKKDCVIAEEWKNKIGEKKVILYNIGLKELLSASKMQFETEGEYLAKNSWYLKKIRSIIDEFEKSEEAVLWWRPHPLFETTLSAMRPGLLQEYREIVQKFKNSNKGIFDESEDLHRAIAWSDGMISDESSLLLLYALTGKPFYVPTITKLLSDPVCNDEADYHTPLKGRLMNMRAEKGANVGGWNCCIWWDNFQEEDYRRNTHFENYVKRFIDFVVHTDKYSEADEYKQLQLQMIKDFVVNADGTAGQKIYDFVKQKVME